MESFSQPFGALTRLRNRTNFSTAVTGYVRPAEKWLMTSNVKTLIQASTISAALSMAFLFSSPDANAQASARYLGTITAISGNTLTVKPDAGDARQVEVPSSAPIKRIAPGQKDLSTAETIQFSDLATGDRVLVKLDPDAPGPPPQAAQIIAIKQADVAQKQEKDREEWQKHGVGGLVKSVDAASGVIALTTGAGATARQIGRASCRERV